MKARGFTLLELLLVLAMGSGLLLGVAYMVNLGMRSHDSGTAETEARQSLEFAMEHIGRALRETQDVLVPNEIVAGRLERNVLAVSLSPVFDANADGYADTDDNRNGLADEEVRQFRTGQALQFPLRDPLPKDATNDDKPGIEGLDDDGDGNEDENVVDCTDRKSNDEESCLYAGSTPDSDWLNAVVFKTEQTGSRTGQGYEVVLYMRKPNPKASNGTWWGRTKHILAWDVQVLNSGQSVFNVKLDKAAAHQTIEVTLCLNVRDTRGNVVRAPVCAKRLWRVGGGA